MDNSKKDHSGPMVLLSAGGTGGHVFPARALAEKLKEQGARVTVATDTRGVKYFGVLDDVEMVIIKSGAYTSGLKGKILGMLALVEGYIQSHRLIGRIKPDVVVGFGGYPSAPPVFAAQHRFIPTILHEQNAILGMANALLAPRAKVLALSVEETSGLKPMWRKKIKVTGNPVRHDIAELAGSGYPDLKGKINLMIVGGSQGAKSFADILPYAIIDLPQAIRDNLAIRHQCRQDDLEKVKAVYSEAGMDVDIRAFFHNMAECIRETHLMITRSGASTVAELTVAGRPAIYIPFPWNRDNQQQFNAEQVEKAGGGIVVKEADLSRTTFTGILAELLENPAKLAQMAEASAKLGVVDAADRLAKITMSIGQPE